ncbi:MAG TPA: hypothetical protein IAC41_05775 [Candidatus Merdenecus merdavium]|nr:hypothetical protein [Candidatus Merdenecus merdavium]
MKKLKYLALFAAVMLVGGCSNNKEETKTPSETETQILKESNIDETVEEIDERNTQENTKESDKEKITENQEFEQKYIPAEVKENQYDGLTITIKEQEDIAPGDPFTLEITIENTGEKSILYSHGSGSHKTPNAFLYNIEGLQNVLPEDKLGIATMDMQMKTLEPGESIHLEAYGRAIQPSDSFDEYTYSLYEKDQSYIGRITWEDLQREFSDLKVAETGKYIGTIYFLYYIHSGEVQDTLLTEASGYNKAEFEVNIR